MDETVTLRIGDRRWQGWESVSVDRSLEQQASTFQLVLTSTHPDSATPVRAYPGSSCTILAGDDPLVTGRIDDLDLSLTTGERGVTVTGRSLACKALICSGTHATGEFKNLTIDKIANQLLAPIGLECLAYADVGAPLPLVRVTPGESVHATIERLARMRALLVTDDTEGHVILTRAGLGRGDPIVWGASPVLSWGLRLSVAERCTHYYGRGQQPGSNAVYGTACSPAALALDDWTEDYLPCVVRCETAADQAAVQRRTDWEAATRAGRSVVVTVTLRGWRRKDGTLWEPGILCRVLCSPMELDAELMVVGVTMTIREKEGTRTTLVLSPQGGYVPEPPAAAKTRGQRITRGVGLMPELDPEE